MVAELIRRDHHRDALPFARRWVTLDPLHEHAHRGLMRIYAALGDRDGVRRQYRTCTDILAHEMDVEPSAETEALYRQLAAAELPAPPERSRPAPADRLDALPFVGRQAELSTLQASLEEARVGRGGFVLVSGEAGIGKTRLIIEFAKRHQIDAGQLGSIGWLTGRCYGPEVRAPYTMWADALQPLATDRWQPLLADLPGVWLQQIARLVPNVTSPTPEIAGVTPAESRLRLLQGVVQALTHLARETTLLLVFEDLHWADEDSLELLHYAVRHLAGTPLLIIGTYRPETVVNNPHLERWLSEVSLTLNPPVMRLEALEVQTINQLLMALKLEISTDLADRLQRHSEGNPLVLLETLRLLVESDSLEQAQLTSLPEAQTLPIPRQVQHLVRTRLATLNQQQQRVLHAAAVIGRPCSFQLLRRVSGLPELQLLDRVEYLLAGAVLEENDDAQSQRSLDFQHSYYRHVIYQELRPGRQVIERLLGDLWRGRSLRQVRRTHPSRRIPPTRGQGPQPATAGHGFFQSVRAWRSSHHDVSLATSVSAV